MTKALYYKTPDADEFVSTTSKTKSVTADSVNGKYEFYVEDNAGNKSSIMRDIFDVFTGNCRNAILLLLFLILPDVHMSLWQR